MRNESSDFQKGFWRKGLLPLLRDHVERSERLFELSTDSQTPWSHAANIKLVDKAEALGACLVWFYLPFNVFFLS